MVKEMDYFNIWYLLLEVFLEENPILPKPVKNSVSRWLFNIWPFAAMKIDQIALKNWQSRFNILPTLN